MEDIGVEVSQKIRSAIKAKLVELGAYVDDELPDYIMVMVANKRTKTQMDNDLKLFLGSNTIHFTGWLHTVLQKLQEVTIASNLNKLNTLEPVEVEKPLLPPVKKPVTATLETDESHKHVKHKKKTKKSSESSTKKKSSTLKKSDKTLKAKVPSVKVLEVKVDKPTVIEKPINIGSEPKLVEQEKKIHLSKVVAVKSVLDSKMKEKSVKKLVVPELPGKTPSLRPSKATAMQSDEEDFEDVINIKDSGMMEFFDEELPEEPLKVTQPKAKSPPPQVIEVDDLEEQRANLLRDLELLEKPARPAVVCDLNLLGKPGRPTIEPYSVANVLERQGSKMSSSILSRLGSKVDVQPRLKIIDPNEFNILGPASEAELSKMRLLDRLGKKQSEALERERSSTSEKKPKNEVPKRNVMERLGGKTHSPVSDDMDSWEKRSLSSSQSRSVPTNEVSHVKDRLGSRSQREKRSSPDVRDRMVWSNRVAETEKVDPPTKKDASKMSDRLGRREASTEREERPKLSDRLGKKLEEKVEGRGSRVKEVPSNKRALPHGDNKMEMDESPRKRGLLSRVIAVKREAPEDEETDGNLAVASVIRIQPRPKVPAAMQANRNLLLKAMAEAQKSVAAAPIRAVPEYSTRMLKNDKRMFCQEVDRKEGLFTHKYRELGSVKINITLTNNAMRPEEEEEEDHRRAIHARRAQNINVTLSKASAAGKKEKDSVAKPTPLPESRARQKITHLSDLEDEKRDQAPSMNQRSLSEKSLPSENSGSVHSSRNNVGSNHSKDEGPAVDEDDDDEVLEEIYEEDEEEEDGGDVSLNASMGGSDVGDGDFKRFASANVDEYIPTGVSYSADEEPELQQTFATAKRSVRSGDKTHFVVTLDCPNPSAYNPRKRTVEHRDRTERPASPLPVPENERIHNWLLSLDSVNEVTERNAPAVVYKRPRLSAIVEPIKPKERCKFWPSCRQGEQCEFAHPSTPCKSFPSCKFGEKCLYVHPKCKYDSLCTRRDCPYTHGAARPATSTLQVKSAVRIRSSHSQPVCKFYPKCSNVNCTFVHPKPCRFGRSCTKVDCSFFHEEIPPAEKLKWVKTSSF